MANLTPEEKVALFETLIEGLPVKIKAAIEGMNQKEEWNSMAEITANVTELQELTIDILQLVTILLSVGEYKAAAAEKLGDKLDDAVKLGAVLELFDGPAFKQVLLALFTALETKILAGDTDEKLKAGIENIIAMLEKFKNGAGAALPA